MDKQFTAESLSKLTHCERRSAAVVLIHKLKSEDAQYITESILIRVLEVVLCVCVCCVCVVCVCVCACVWYMVIV